MLMICVINLINKIFEIQYDKSQLEYIVWMCYPDKPMNDYVNMKLVFYEFKIK